MANLWHVLILYFLHQLQEKEARRFFQQIISGVDYCHRHMVVHRYKINIMIKLFLLQLCIVFLVIGWIFNVYWVLKIEIDAA